ncbi:DUF3289 family protein [Mixta calida]|uniref:DUF3289 family protein n=3 Tax=Mixta calida TaxID=665913 RepID=UPI00289E61AF|nr:DUF3289 family protein [Mixta calida]
MTESQSRLSMDLPCLLFATRHEMDDYCAPDMLYGDLSAEVLRRQYHLRDISAHLNPFTHPNREESARILFDEFRYLADTFAFWGPYKGLARTMITHMQDGNGTVFSDPLLDQAMSEHSSMKEAVNQILKLFNQYIFLLDNELTKIKFFDEIIKGINKIRLPKFDSFEDRFNGLGITVHDTWATHIFLDSFQITRNRYTANVRFRMQDHFGLDINDISNNFYRQFRLFRIWFILQRWEFYLFRPFITEIVVHKKIEGYLSR